MQASGRESGGVISTPERSVGQSLFLRQSPELLKSLAAISEESEEEAPAPAEAPAKRRRHDSDAAQVAQARKHISETVA